MQQCSMREVLQRIVREIECAHGGTDKQQDAGYTERAHIVVLACSCTDSHFLTLASTLT